MQLERHETAQGLGEVNITPEGHQLRITATVLMKPHGKFAMGWQTGVALDASTSMANRYGQGVRWANPQLKTHYQQLQLLKRVGIKDGKEKWVFSNPQAREMAIQSGHITRVKN